METYLKPGLSVIDVGCGSAILAIAAAKLGAAPVVAVDIDAQALENARHNMLLNEVDIEISVGSVAELQSGLFGLRRADLVLANILAPVLVRLLDQGLAKLMKEGGVLILSGILEEQEREMRRALDQARLKVIEERRIEDWLGLAAQVR
jgi:ribosomal protein L11 methyltransferase